MDSFGGSKCRLETEEVSVRIEVLEVVIVPVAVEGLDELGNNLWGAGG